MSKQIDTLNKHLGTSQQFAQPKKGRKALKRVNTFADLVSADMQKCNYGFVYEIKIDIDGKIYNYIGSKSFKTDNWGWYTSSSKRVKQLIKQGYPVQYAVLAYAKDNRSLLANESKYINLQIIPRLQGCNLNLAQVDGAKITKKYYNIFV